MKIAVYCGSQEGLGPEYMQAALALGRFIGTHGHTLVYGGSTGGLMGAVADGAAQTGAEIIGVVPRYEEIVHKNHPALTECIYTENFATRKLKMMELADAYIALPGGTGTLDEITDVLALARIGQELKPVVFVNTLGFYEPLREMFAKMEEARFIWPEDLAHVLFEADIDAIGHYIERK